jgi:hypothetical protein
MERLFYLYGINGYIHVLDTLDWSDFFRSPETYFGAENTTDIDTYVKDEHFIETDGSAFYFKKLSFPLIANNNEDRKMIIKYQYLNTIFQEEDDGAGKWTSHNGHIDNALEDINYDNGNTFVRFLAGFEPDNGSDMYVDYYYSLHTDDGHVTDNVYRTPFLEAEFILDRQYDLPYTEAVVWTTYNTITGEIVDSTGLTPPTTYDFTLGNIPVAKNSITLYFVYLAVTYEIHDNGLGYLVSDEGYLNIANSVVNYDTGVCHLDFDITPDPSTDIMADYGYSTYLIDTLYNFLLESSITLTFTIGGIDYTESDNGAGALTNVHGFIISSLIDYDTGLVTVAFNVSINTDMEIVYRYNNLWNNDIDVLIKNELNKVKHALTKFYYSFTCDLIGEGQFGPFSVINDNGVIVTTTGSWISSDLNYFGLPNIYLMDMLGDDNTLGFNNDTSDYYTTQEYTSYFLPLVTKYKFYYKDGTTDIGTIRDKSKNAFAYEDEIGVYCDGYTATFEFTLGNIPVSDLGGNVVVYFFIGGDTEGDIYTLIDDGSSLFTSGTGIGYLTYGQIDYATGVINLSFNTNPWYGTDISVNYLEAYHEYTFIIYHKSTAAKTLERMELINEAETIIYVSAEFPNFYVPADYDINISVQITNT